MRYFLTRSFPAFSRVLFVESGGRELAEKRLFPAVDVDASSTRKEEILMDAAELKIIWQLRRVLHALEPQQALELLLEQMRKTKSNAEFLMQVQKTTLGS